MIHSIIEILSEKYDIIGEPINLSDFYLPNGESKIFNTLINLYQKEFSPSQKILVIQPDKDLYSYPDNYSSDSLIFLQQCLQKIDISNCFVTIITGNPDIDNELKWLQQTHSIDDHSIDHILVNTPFKKTILQSDTFCVNLWNHLYVTTQLEVVPCCRAKDDEPLGSLTTQTVAEIINGDAAKNMRIKMLSNQRCTQCKTCYDEEDAGRLSKRKVDNELFKVSIDRLKLLTKKDGSLTEFLPQTLDIRLNNICNLKCRTCSGVASSQLALEEKRLFNNKVNFEKIPNLNLRNQVFKSVIDYFKTAESVYFAGGEPLIIKEHYDILDYLIENNRTDISILYNTNFTNLIFKDKNILDYWKKFLNIKVGASLDGHGKVFEYVRHGAKWNDIEKNLQQLKNHCPHVTFKVNSTVSLLSVESIIELQRMWHENKILHISCFKMGLMVGNDFLSLKSLPLEYKKNISKKINKHCNWLTTVGATELLFQWQDIQKDMMSKDKSYVNFEFAKVNRTRDLARNENFELTYPQFADLFRPYYK
jgi:organic radical activating enzyme